MNHLNDLPVKELYESRRNFTVIGLTGLAGSGCSTLSGYMSSKAFLDDEKLVRRPDEIHVDEIVSDDNMTLYHEDQEKSNETVIHQMVFRRKYEICHTFALKNYSKYYVIKYTSVIWLYVLLFTKEKLTTPLRKEDIWWKIDQIAKDKFRPQRDRRDNYSLQKDEYFDTYNYVEELSKINEIDWDGLVKLICEKLEKADSGNYYANNPNELFEIFNEPVFRLFVKGITSYFTKKSYYLLCLMYHRLACAIRATGSPVSMSAQWKETKDTSHIFDLIKLVNTLIKGKRHSVKNEDSEGTRIVIDSIRNSLESLYLKERYAAYYLFAVHDDANRIKHLEQKIRKHMSDLIFEQNRNEDKVKRELTCIMNLTEKEAMTEDFETGIFFSPNVGQCIADAEVHISNSENTENKPYVFYTMAEQWMKYSSLILHPGLITPSSEERCMVVAYTAKFNSTCLSRQVGACITNQYHSIRTIGWNEVPYGHIPCGLRDVRELRNHKKSGYKDSLRYVYSDFERGETRYNDGFSFVENVDLFLSSHPERNLEKLEGIHYPYCFKSYHNTFEGKINQVHTRSLHAEENAIIQMAKYGGEKLINGIIYVTASPCELCSKKLYQIGVRQIVYIDPYPGIARANIIGNGLKHPTLKLFQGAYGQTYFKLYQPFMPLKDEIKIRLGEKAVWDLFQKRKQQKIGKE